MFTKIIRKQYDPSGTENILNIPYKTVVEYFDGSIQSDRYSISDAYNINNINIEDDHSNGLISLTTKILAIKQQDRCQINDFKITQGYFGYSLNRAKIAQLNTIVQENLQEINIENLFIENIKVFKCYKSSGNVSYMSPPKIEVIMDNRETMNSYPRPINFVYATLPKSIICKENGELNDWAKQLLPEDVNPENYYEETDEWGVTTNNGGNIYDTSGEPFISINDQGFLNYNERLNNCNGCAIIAIFNQLNLEGGCILLGVEVGKSGNIPIELNSLINSNNIDFDKFINVYKTDKYLTDGLISMFDYTSATENTWKDIVSGDVFNSNNPITLDSNGVPYFNGENWYKGKYRNNDSSLCTIEVVFKSEKIKEYTIYAEDGITTSSNKLFVLTSNNNNFYFSGQTPNANSYIPKISSYTKDDLICLSRTINYCLWNGSDLTASTAGYISLQNTNNSYIGTKKEFLNPFKGKIYCIRIYNRILSKSEIIYNQQIDAIRFGSI